VHGRQLFLFPEEVRGGAKKKATESQPLSLTTRPVLADRLVSDSAGAWMEFASDAAGTLEHLRDLASQGWCKGGVFVLEVHATWYPRCSEAEAEAEAREELKKGGRL